MVYDDTHIGGAGDRFPATRLSAIHALDSNDQSEKTFAWERLIGAYWKPVYKYLRIRWQLSNENAKDATQSFFTSAMEKSFFNGYTAEKSRFRTFLRVCLDRFIANQKKSENREKRGGKSRHLALDFESAEGEIRELPLSDNLSAEDLFEQEWMRSIFEISINQLKEKCANSGKELHFELFTSYDLHDSDIEKRPSYQQLADHYQIPSTQVTNFLAAVRRQFRATVLENLREITASDDEFRQEVRIIFGIDLTS